MRRPDPKVKGGLIRHIRRFPASRTVLSLWGGGLLTLPGYDALNDIVNQVDPHSLAQAINQWLIAHSDLLPKSLAIDGKDLGGKGRLGAIVTLCHHHTGAPLVMRTYTGEKNDCELPASQQLIEEASGCLANSVLTGDALNAQKNGADHPSSRCRLLSRPQRRPTHPARDRPSKA